MDLRNLEGFFLDRISVGELANEIDREVDLFRIARAKKGSSAPVRGTNEDFHFTVAEKDLRKLCEMYLERKINEWHLEYLCNLLEMSPAFSMSSEKVEDAVFELSSPEINSPITRKLVSEIYEDLS